MKVHAWEYVRQMSPEVYERDRRDEVTYQAAIAPALAGLARIVREVEVRDLQVARQAVAFVRAMDRHCTAGETVTFPILP